ncbi:MAG: hypothetical protein ABSE49_33510 [Polyangiaceae bacterium]|jgi:hypothetical protein
MSRWLVAGGLLLLVLACKPKSYSPDDGDDGGGGDDSGDDGGVCNCEIPTSATDEVTIPCGQSACVGETGYQCSPEGIPLVGVAGACGGESDAPYVEEGQCVPNCPGVCGVSDTCGGTCACPDGIPCNPNGTCGNGCKVGPGETCLTDDAGPTTCCSSGYACRTGDSGANTCCAPNADGMCTQDSDCCNYPTAHCSTTTHTCG